MNTLWHYLKKHAFAVLLLLLGLHITVFQFCGYDLKNIVGDLGDTRFILSIMEYNYQWLVGNYSSYWDGFFMYPDQEVISYSDNLLGITPVYAIFRFLQADMYLAFQLTMIASHLLNFVFCYFCFNRITQNKYAAASGAFVFAFDLLLNGFHNYPQFAFRFCTPLFFYFLVEYLTSQNLRQLIYALLALVFQFYLGIYLGYFLFFSGLLMVAAYYITHFEFAKLRRGLVHGMFAVPMLALLLGPMFYYYYKRYQTTGYYADYDLYMQMVPRLSSYFKAFPGAVSWGVLENTNVGSRYDWFHLLFPGALVIISIPLGFYALVREGRRSAFLMPLAILVLAISFTTYYNGHTMYGYVMKIPGIKSVRVVSRFETVFIFFGAWLVCEMVNYSLSRQTRYKTLILALLPVLLVFDNATDGSRINRFSKQEARERVAQLRTKVESQNGSKSHAFAYLHGIKKDNYLYNIDAMLCALELKTKTVNAYSSAGHHKFGDFWNNADSITLVKWCQDMSLNPDSLVIVK